MSRPCLRRGGQTSRTWSAYLGSPCRFHMPSIALKGAQSYFRTRHPLAERQRRRLRRRLVGVGVGLVRHVEEVGQVGRLVERPLRAVEGVTGVVPDRANLVD